MREITFFLFTLLLLTSSCNNDDDRPCLSGNGQEDNFSFTTNNFNRVDLLCEADVFFGKGQPRQVDARGFSNIINALRINAQDRLLEIDSRRCVVPGDQPKVFLTIPEIDGLSITGSGNITSDERFFSGDLDLLLLGSGNMDIATDVNDLEATLTGSGNMELEGTADLAYFYLAGSGNMEAFDMRVREAEIELIGSGDIEIYARDFLLITLSGSGNVYFKGDPVLDIVITGSGEVIDAN
jgi:hypothetical protein